jgi:hypothetical protein
MPRGLRVRVQCNCADRAKATPSWPIAGIWFDWLDLYGLSDVDRTYRLSEKCILMASGEMFRTPCWMTHTPVDFGRWRAGCFSEMQTFACFRFFRSRTVRFLALSRHRCT